MAKKPDISTKKLLPWDEYKNKTSDLALASIYAYIESVSTTMCAWYWTSIGTKRWTSLWVRAITFLLLTIGTSLPIFAAIQDLPKDKLLFTQWAVALLAIAGLIQVADRVFGWSSGWMRYISTVTTMENLTRAFELEWANYIVSKSAPLDTSDVKSLFELARTLEQELTKLQAEETTKWISEFNSSISLLESMIKSQREETDKKLDAIRTNLSTQATAAKADEKTKLPGAIEVAFIYKAEPKKIKIKLDSETPVEFIGYTWSKLNVSPGQHVLSIETVTEPPQIIQKVVEVQASTVARPEIKFVAY
ncbi:MAG: SLATT domain-containing protein [Desulfobulbaceae bacterium]|nr:SLATT domain-containing protein [Desulfobulbaceae bacterium]